jgi:hypothetical protein
MNIHGDRRFFSSIRSSFDQPLSLNQERRRISAFLKGDGRAAPAAEVIFRHAMSDLHACYLLFYCAMRESDAYRFSIKRCTHLSSAACRRPHRK